MSDKDNGGPAFPYVSGDTTAFGMSLRDYFAAHAPTPPEWWLKSYAERSNHLEVEGETLAIWAYAYADSMLKERAK